MSQPVALVTGGSAGIGLGIARRLLERGCQVVITARGEERLRTLAGELGVTGVAADVATEEGRATIVAEIRRLGRLDWLVNNAGTGGGTAGLDVDVERARRVLETNFYSHVALTHALWPLLREAPRARVISVSSSLGTYSSSGSITYGASKAALTSWGRGLAVAARRAGIEVTLVNPGPVATTTFPHTELLAHRWKRRLVIDVERCVDDVMRTVDRGGGEVWSHPIFRLPAVLQAVAPCTYDRFLVQRR
ncbi:MAG TPA: SDR family oxidoreductase [Gaiellales bacterium]|nr:SDR family oxidoreductase [Gaiellales bacterium]